MRNCNVQDCNGNKIVVDPQTTDQSVNAFAAVFGPTLKLMMMVVNVVEVMNLKLSSILVIKLGFIIMQRLTCCTVCG